MRNFWIQMWSSYKGLYDYSHPRGYIANVILYPVVAITMFALLGRYAMDQKMAVFMGVGMMVSCMNFNIISAITQSYANERYYGTLNFLYLTRANRLVNYLSRFILHYPTGLLAGAASMIMIKLVTNVDFGAVNWGVLIPAFLVINLSICAFSQFLSIFAIIFTEWLNTLGFSLSVCFILTGIVLPLDVLPKFLQETGKLLPMTNGLIAIRAAFNSAPLGDIYFSIIREAITGIVFFTVGYFCFVTFEKIAKRTGVLEMESS